ncbi:MAG TPA: NAD(+) diphosphatase [Gammaproteobacteria bacterium]|nr:NAD(+) diphosphatase [Gammaproteobacteria bacterium]
MDTLLLERSSILRSDDGWIDEKLHDSRSRIIPLYNRMVLCTNGKIPTAVYLTHQSFPDFFDLYSQSFFLGIYDGTPYFCINIEHEKLALNFSNNTNVSFQDLKSIISLLRHPCNELLSLANFMLFWHSRNLFCGRCGSKTQSFHAGHVRTCGNTICNEQYYPNMDPAIIALVTYRERCLLGRQKEWPEGMYSTLAGFVEPGEAIEEAVAREVKEEAGISIENIKYQSSQSWLFPNSLMLGFTADAKEDIITINRDELEDVRWFTGEEIRSSPEILPYTNSIAYKLITTWLDGSD